uniref:Uncharacterized protein n=1 Tax=uncultured prokaryote TaxID=198431 RepID=A0A0H5Q2I9_9ZZZZ|nr:hypothetical protein [uncultured prokaryote]
MGVYKFQATSVGYWRGVPKRWQNSFHFDVSNDAAAANCLDDFKAKIRALGDNSTGGGLASAACYNVATGGVPVGSAIYFDWKTPADWVAFPTGGPWDVEGTRPLATEAAARFRTQAGVGRTGKPVYVGIYWHSFVASNADTATPGFSAPVVAAAKILYNSLQTLQADGEAVAVQVTPTGGAIAGSGTLLQYVDAHQRVRGRRRKAVTIDGKRYYPAAKTANTIPVEAD